MSDDQSRQAQIDKIKRYCKDLSTGPGVYRMFSKSGTVLYVGKARNLKNRVSSYFNDAVKPVKTTAMVQLADRVEVTRTHTEAEALLLESTLIKKLKPPFNVMLRDDKSYPYIKLSKHAYPRMSVFRGSPKNDGEYFGPYPNAYSVRASLEQLQRLFYIRSCTDNYFKNRSRPCLQHQIERCSAPCVQKLTTEAYAEDLRQARLFLQGRNQDLVDELAVKMQQASDDLNFESAAKYRDTIRALSKVQQQQNVTGMQAEADIIAFARQGAISCVTVIGIRNGANQGHEHFYPTTPADTADNELLSAFLSLYYANRYIPPEIILPIQPDDAEALQTFLHAKSGRTVKQKAKTSVEFKTNVRAERKQWLTMAQATATQGLTAKVNADATVAHRLDALRQALDLANTPSRIECFDISHTQGEATVGSCVVYDEQGPSNKNYRLFNITDVTPGDDYAAMRQVLTRRYKRVKNGELPVPDLVLIDGGKGQLSQAKEVMAELSLNEIPLLGIAKGPSRKAGLEELFWEPSGMGFTLPDDSPALHLIQQIRDESHRFAIAGHRSKRAKARKESPLEHIAGLGPKRRKSLLNRFGGLKGIQTAGIADLAATPGISKALAQVIYDHFHSG